MEDIRSVLSLFHSKKKRDHDPHLEKSGLRPTNMASSSEIPDLFFDEILKKYKLNRTDISLLMFLYRQVWCRPNLYKAHGIGPLNSYADLCSHLQLGHEELVQHLRALENYGFIETVRAGQYFVRKFFTEELDIKFGQNYDEFL